ncbi:MAG: response regulator transcription factor [Firmicutes bacterium]|nr:response regulator transcription factor [Bacillota bacterium]
MKIMIVDDHAVVRKGLIQILEEKPGIYTIDEASSGDELINKLKTNDYDVIILDISMPGRDGLEVLKFLRNVKPNIPVLAFSMYPEEQYAIRLLKSGASGYLNKECPPEEFVKAIERVANGQKYVSPQLGEILINNLGMQDAPLHDALSDREFQVMCMTAKGRTPTQISHDLSLSINTVSTYRIRILEKLGLKNTAEITHYAIKNRLVE